MSLHKNDHNETFVCIEGWEGYTRCRVFITLMWMVVLLPCSIVLMLFIWWCCINNNCLQRISHRFKYEQLY